MYFNFKREGNYCCCMVNITHLKIFTALFPELGSSEEIINSEVNGIAIHYLRKVPVFLLPCIPSSATFHPSASQANHCCFDSWLC